MSFDIECAELIKRHMADLGKNITVEAILRNPRYERVWSWWKALAYFRMDSHYRSLEEAPVGIKWITVVEDEVWKNYQWKDNRYEYAQQMSKEDCKKIYGN